MTASPTFGRWLKQRRVALGLTRPQLAARIGYAVATLRHVEADEARPSRELAERLADALAIPPPDHDAFLSFARDRATGEALPPPIQSVPVAFPPAPSRPTNLPVPLTRFIGRERELRRLTALIPAARLVTLTGVGGAGKTRLALHLAADLAPNYPDGVWLVELAGLADPALLPHAVAASLGVREQPPRPILDILTDFLRTKHLLLLLDNCEHLIEAAAHLAAALLHVCPQLTLLTTSREALNIAGEMVFHVPPLAFPDPTSELSAADPVADLARYEAVQLFIDRATSVYTAFAVTPRTAPILAQLCQRLDGLPLAIELAAARVKALSLEQIARRLDDRFQLLTGGSRTAPERHQTLRAVIDWSFALLPDAERAALRRLSIFAGGWTLDAAEAVCADARVAASEVLDLLARLVDKSLVEVKAGVEEARYRMLETIRQYAREKLVEAGEEAAVAARHLAFYLALAEEGDRQARGPEQLRWFERLESEHHNFRAALAWSGDDAADVEAGLQLAGSLGLFWLTRGYWTEGRGRLERVLAHPGAALPTAARARALWALGTLSDMVDAGERDLPLEESARLWRALGDQRGLATTLRLQGFIRLIAGDYAAARLLFDESLTLWRAAGDAWGVAYALGDQGQLARRINDPTWARAVLEESLAGFQTLGDQLKVAMTRMQLGLLAMEAGDSAAARPHLEARLTMARQVGESWGIYISLLLLGYVALRLGDIPRAAAHLTESLALVRPFGIRRFVVEGLSGMAAVALANGQLARAAWLCAAADRHGVVAPLYRSEYDHALAAARAALSPDDFAAAWAEGQASTLDQAIDYALHAENQALV